MRPPRWLAQVVLGIPLYWWAAVWLIILLLGLALVTRVSGVPGAQAVDQAQVVLAGQPWETATTVELPHVWDDAQRRWAGEAHYRMVLPASLKDMAGPDGPGIGLLLPRVSVRFRVLFNGEEVDAQAWARGIGYADTGTHAHFIALRPSMLATQWADNRLEIQLKGQALRFSGLSPVWVGPRDALWQRHHWLNWWQVTLTWMVAASALMLGLLSLLIWAKSAERLFGLLAGGLLVLAVRLWLSTPVFLPGPFLWWDYVHKLSFTLYCGFTYLFMSELFNFRQSMVRKLVLLMMLLAPFWLGLLAWTLNYQLYRLWTGVIVLVCVLSLLMVIHRARWGMDVQQRLMVVVGLATMVTGLRDFLVVQMGLPGDVDIRWMTPGSLVMMFAMGSVLLQRTALSMENVGRQNAELARQVGEREQEFHAVYERLRLVENQRVLEAERRRLTRDMHDGLGSQLVQTLNLVRSSSGSIDSASVAAMLNHALEELRMTLDSLEPMDGDLPTILGTLRQRIGPALQAAQIELVWQVEEVPAVPGLEARGVMHLFRCLQEVFANVVKHAHASRVTVRTWAASGRVHLSVTDNGVGLGDTPDLAFSSGGRGISNVRLRAAEIGAEVVFSVTWPGTCVAFSFVAGPAPDQVLMPRCSDLACGSC
ncbi:sensor histidine kinase [Hydrogenophaga sp.]|uniref:sensor histidine kinase n=1 Tax=Hydrogenophaga sp. TaxID=1904254 RepID=UPI003F6B454E